MDIVDWRFEKHYILYSKNKCGKMKKITKKLLTYKNLSDIIMTVA